MGTQRMPAEKRRAQIVQVALKTIDKYGINGATMGRISRNAGVSQSALYVHFRSRKEILLAVLDAIYEEIFEIQEFARTDDVFGGLAVATEQCYSSFVGGRRKRGHAHLLLEFATSSPKHGLRNALRDKQIDAMKHLAGIIEVGKQQGSIHQDVDSEQLAWMLTGWSWAADVAKLMGLATLWYPDVSSRLRRAMLRDASACRQDD